MTDGEVWSRWVGSQSPREWLHLPDSDPWTPIALRIAVDAYVEVRLRQWRGPRPSAAEKATIREALYRILAAEAFGDGVAAREGRR